MFSLFGSPPASCPRCRHTGFDDAAHCAHCGFAGDSTRKDPVLHENCWLPGADEVALFFSVSQSDSAWTRRLHVPAGARAYLWQNQKIIAAPAAEEEAEGFFSRIKALVQGPRVDMLIARQNTFALECAFDDLHSAEFMQIAASFSLSVRIAQVDAFARQFMGRPGVVSCRHLQQLVAPALRRIALEFFSAQSLRELQQNTDLRRQLDARLLSALNAGISQSGLAITQVATLQVRHDKLCAEREKLGEKIASLWLIVDGKRAQLEHGKRLDALYSIGEWQKIAHEEQQVRLRYRREEMRQKFGKDLSWLYLQGQREDAKKRLARAQLKQDENERMQLIRARELELYGRIAESATRKEAIERGAGDSIRELEHAFKDKAEQRQNAADQWLHVRTMARIKMRNESELTVLEGKQAAQAFQQKMQLQQQKEQLEHQIEQARLIEDQAQAQTRRQAQTQAQQQQQEHLARREQEQADARASHEKLLRTLQLHASLEQQAQQQRHQAGLDQLEQDKQRLLLRQDEDQARWQREQQSADAEHAQQVLLARLALERIGVIANLSETGKVATADGPNAAALADILKLQTQAGMSAEQILATQAGLSQHAAQAMSAIATTQQGMSSAQAIALLQERLREDRAYSERQSEQERRHQLDLAMAQNTQGKNSANPGQTGRK